MGKYADEEWYKRLLAEYSAQYGDVPPPWVYVPTSHPWSIRWRMGKGETLLMVFHEWWEQQNYSEDQRIAYFRKWPPPPRWIPWMVLQIWDLEPPGPEMSPEFLPYYARLAELGFPSGTQEIQHDLDDEKWLIAESKGCA